MYSSASIDVPVLNTTTKPRKKQIEFLIEQLSVS